MATYVPSETSGSSPADDQVSPLGAADASSGVYRRLVASAAGALHAALQAGTALVGKFTISDGTDDVEVTADGDLQTSAVLRGKVSTDNSSSTPLGAGATFTGTAEDVSDYACIYLQVYSDQASASDGLVIEYSTDGTNFDSDDSFTISADESEFYTLPPQARYMRVRYTNGATPQTVFRLQISLKHTYAIPSSHRLDANLSNQDDAELVRAVITGEDENGDFPNVALTTDGRLRVSTAAADEVGVDFYKAGIGAGPTWYILIDLDNSTGDYPHTYAAGEGIQVRGYNTHMIKSTNNAQWDVLFGVILAINGTQATIAYFAFATVHITDTTNLSVFQQGTFTGDLLDLTVSGGTISNVVAGLKQTTTSVNTGTPLTDAAGNSVTPAVGDVVYRVERTGGSVSTLTLHTTMTYLVG